eukprot:g8312.t1
MTFFVRIPLFELVCFLLLLRVGFTKVTKGDGAHGLAFRPIKLHRESRSLKQDFRSVAGNFFGDLINSVVDRNKDSEAENENEVYLGQIVGGSDALIDRYPFICSLRHRQSKKHFCGGSLIQKNVVLTAAHCVDHRDANIIRPIVHIGQYHRTKNGRNHENIETKKTVIHPEWDPETNANDLALIFLQQDSTYKPISLKKEKSSPNAYLAVLGWGRTEEGGNASENLQEVVVPVLRQDKCREAYGARISDSMFCAGQLSGGKDACQGDSGGPIIKKESIGTDLLVGVVSWGVGCAREGKPGVYASVSHARAWIEEEIEKLNGNEAPPSPSPPKEETIKEKSPSTTIECQCSEDGWSGNVRTSRKGCKQHLKAHGDDDYFCMVTEGTQCEKATPSEAYPGASWMMCEPTEEEINQSSNLDLADIWRQRPPSIKLKLGPLSFRIKLKDEEEDEQKDPCECAADGYSGSVDTEFEGCKQHSSKQGRYDYWCMVTGGTVGCTEAKPSNKYKGDISNAIQSSKQEQKPLIVFLKRSDEESEAVEKKLLDSELVEIVEQSIVLRLEDDLEDTVNPKFNNARMFRQLYPVEELPAVVLLGVNGPSVVTIKGNCSLEELKIKLMDGLQIYKRQLEGKKEEPPRDDELAVQSSTPEVSPSAASLPEQTEVVQKPIVKKKKKKEAAKPTPPPPPPEYHTSVLRFRLTNDEFIENEFSADVTLREVFSYLDIHRTDGGAPYVLEMMYPRRSLGENEYSKSLRELDLVPRCSLRLSPIKGNQGMSPTAATAAAGDSSEGGGLISGLFNVVGATLNLLNPIPFFASILPSHTVETTTRPERAPPQEDQIPERNHHHQRQQSVSSTVRRRSNWGGNVYSLHDPENEDSDKRNSFWNGNSTEFGSNSHED